MARRPAPTEATGAVAGYRLGNNLEDWQPRELLTLARHLRTLAAYATAAAAGKDLRGSGIISGALQAEGNADAYYKQLPSAWRW